jgi:hypothetical protein
MHWKAVSITNSERVYVALGILHTMHMCHIVTCGLPDSTIFSTLSCKWYDKKKNVTDQKCVFSFSLKLLSHAFLTPRRNEQDMIKKHILIFM